MNKFWTLPKEKRNQVFKQIDDANRAITKAQEEIESHHLRMETLNKIVKVQSNILAKIDHDYGPAN